MYNIIDLFHSVVYEIWASPASRLQSLAMSVISKLTAKDWEIISQRPEMNLFGEQMPKLEISNGVAVIPIKGDIMKDVPVFIKQLFGIADIRDTQSDLTQSLADPTVDRIVLDIDTLGGLASASDELAGDIEQARNSKPIMAYIQNKACSAGYEIASPTQMIIASEHAIVGNIGSLATIVDASSVMAAMGVKMDVITSGDFKSIGYAPLTEDQREYLQSNVNAAGERFRDFVRRNRPGVKEEDMQGQWFRGEEAAQKNLIAGTAKNLQIALASFRRLI